MRAGVIVPAILAVLLLVAIVVAVFEAGRADNEDRPSGGPDHDICHGHQTDIDTATPTTRAATVTVSDDHDTTDDHRHHDIGATCRRGDRRRLLPRRQHGHDGRRVHRLLLHAAEHRYLDLVADPG